MQVLPVLDLKAGRVVHARGGHRTDYQPLQSVWSPRADNPLALTAALRKRFRVAEWYVADLDALQGGVPQTDVVQSLLASDLRLWLDAGVRTLPQATALLQTGIHRLILASETLPSRSLVTELVQTVGPERLVFSLDLRGGQVQSPPGVFSDPTPLPVAETVLFQGITQLLVLDTAAVGVGRGPATLELCRQLRHRHPHLTLISGGGVRHAGDLAAVAASSVDFVLVATALHADRDFAAQAFQQRGNPDKSAGMP